jgi:pyruvate/2-oxoglutarate dehydrogenase complex dihydrolipoamide dehydrogenase (E3) component
MKPCDDDAGVGAELDAGAQPVSAQRPESMVVEPWDRHNQALVANVHPEAWRNPEPAGRYNLVVIGAGTAGLVTAAGAAGLGARVALVERELMGGDCLNVGCVPSKGLIRAARAAADVRGAGEYGIRVPPGTTVDFGAVMERMRRLRAEISRTDAAARFRDLGVDVFFGPARFAGADAVEVAGRTLRFRRAVIATGARAAAPPIPGLADAGYLTNETVFTLTELPRRLAVIGAGPIGCELAQAFVRFGAEVSLLGRQAQILTREDRDAAERVERAMVRDGVCLQLGAKIERVERAGGDRIIYFSRNGGTDRLAVDQILVGVGRSPNVEGLDLERVGVAYDPRAGVTVDDRLRTTNPRIYAAGDVVPGHKYTHNSDFQARIVIQNALFFGRARASALTMPWSTYTDPEIAHVGLYERDAAARGIGVRTFVQELQDVDRAVLDGEALGFVKVHVRAGSDKILGATIVARHAGEMLPELTMAIAHGIGLGRIASVIHSYPTQAEAIRKLGDAYNRTRLTPLVKRVFGAWLAFSRR